MAVCNSMAVCNVERVFAHLKQHNGYRVACYRGIDKNRLQADIFHVLTILKEQLL